MTKENNILHCFSTPFHPAGNGACERVNQTIIQRLKGLDEWDDEVPRLVVQYNNMVHRETKMTPSQMILTKPHMTKPTLVTNPVELKNWKEGHPNFSPFKPKQKVLKQIMRKGHQLKSKLNQKYAGPYIVSRVNSNGLSYEIYKEGKEDESCKVNYRQLRKYNELPKYLSKYFLNAR